MKRLSKRNETSRHDGPYVQSIVSATALYILVALGQILYSASGKLPCDGRPPFNVLGRILRTPNSCRHMDNIGRHATGYCALFRVIQLAKKS